jgi:glutaminyl-tRNA synthetase
VVLDNYPAGQVEEFVVPDFPQDPECTANRKVPFGRELYIEQEDFMETPPPKYFRLAPGKEVRLMNAYYVTCTDLVKDASGKVVEVHCSYDPDTRGGMSADRRKVRGTIHWVSAQHAIEAEVRLYENLFTKKDPYEVEEGQDFLDNLNPHSLEVLTSCKLEPALAQAVIGEPYQFMRNGYFCLDSLDSNGRHLVFNRTISLVDSWAKMQGTSA